MMRMTRDTLGRPSPKTPIRTPPASLGCASWAKVSREFTDARGPAGPIASEWKSGAAALASGPIYEADSPVNRATRLMGRSRCRGGRKTDLVAALRDCRRVLARRAGKSAPAWESLATRATLLNGRLARLANPPTDRHEATNPRRPARRARFLRASCALTYVSDPSVTG
jgi:hypothetical protein